MSSFSDKIGGVIGPNDFKSLNVRIGYWLMFLFMVIVSLICILPPIWIITSAFKDVNEFMQVPPTLIPRSFHPEIAVKAWKEMDFLTYYKNSFFVIVGGVVCNVVFCGLLAYVISRLKPKGYKIMYFIVLLSMMIPAAIGMVPLYKNIIAFNMMNTYFPLWLMQGANAFSVLLYKGFFDELPQSLFEAARIDGCSNLGMFFRIAVPLSKAIIAVQAIFTINGLWSEFFWSFLTLPQKEMQTVMVRLYYASSASRNAAGVSIDVKMWMLTFAIVPPILLFIIFQKQILNNMTFSGIKG